MKRSHLATVLLATVTLSGQPSQAQGHPPAIQHALADSSVPRIMAQARKAFPGGVVTALLRSRETSSAKREELADSVVELAIWTKDATSAVGAIGAAGYPAEPGYAGEPNAHALDWLIRIHRLAVDDGTRSTALFELTRQVDPSPALPYLRQVAMSSTDRTAPAALINLFRLVGDETRMSVRERQQLLDDLRRMWEQHLVSNRLAMVDFRKFAALRRWPPAN